jgi:hypothetical protein
LAKTPEQWLAQPNRLDIPKVDTPKQKTDQLGFLITSFYGAGSYLSVLG